MRKLAVVHHDFKDFVPALREAEPRLDVRGWHPRDLPDDPWIADAEGLFAWRIPPGLLQRMPASASGPAPRSRRRKNSSTWSSA